VPENLFEKLYDAEWNRRNELLGATSLPAGVLALLGTGLAVLVREYPSGGGYLDYAFWPLFGSSCAAFVVATYMLVRSLFVGRYEQIPFSSQLDAYRAELQQRYNAVGSPLLADRQFEAFLEQRFITAANANGEHNAKRDAYLQKALRGIVVSIVALGVASVPFSIRVRTAAPLPQNVETTSDTRPTLMRTENFRSSDARSIPPEPIPP
jgi:hypothetical protein